MNHPRKTRLLGLLIALTAVAGCGGAAGTFDGGPFLAVLRSGSPPNSVQAYPLVEQSVAAAAALESYTARFEKQERIGGALRPLEEIDVEVRRRPFSVRMTWVGRVDRRKEALYVEGENDDRLRVWAGQLAAPLLLNLAPDSSLAMADNRHPMTRMGLATLARGLLERSDEPHPAPSESFRYLGRTTLDGRPADMVGRAMTAAPAKSSGWLLAGLDAESRLPLLVARYDDAGQLLELYRYRHINPAARLTDQDFDFSRLGKGR
jgi:hypothetical protein